MRQGHRITRHARLQGAVMGRTIQYRMQARHRQQFNSQQQLDTNHPAVIVHGRERIVFVQNANQQRDERCTRRHIKHAELYHIVSQLQHRQCQRMLLLNRKAISQKIRHEFQDFAGDLLICGNPQQEMRK
jgi:hypothetical protein